VKRIVVLLVVAATLTGCVNTTRFRTEIESCIAAGGDPQYTYNRAGEVVSFYGCAAATEGNK
jgi:hypothetical protein